MNLGDLAPDHLLELAFDLVRALEADLARDLGDHVRVDLVLPVAELDVQAAPDIWMRLDHLANASRELRPARGDILAGDDHRLHRFEVDVDPRRFGELGFDRPLQRAAGLGRVRQREVAGHLRVHGQVKRAVGFALHGDVVQVADAAVPRRRGVDALHDVGSLLLPFDGDREVEAGQHRAGLRLNCVGEAARRFDREHAAGGDARVADQAWSRPPDTDRAHLAHAVHIQDGRAQLRLGPRRRAVDEDVARTPRT